MEGASGS